MAIPQGRSLKEMQEMHNRDTAVERVEAAAVTVDPAAVSGGAPDAAAAVPQQPIRHPTVAQPGALVGQGRGRGKVLKELRPPSEMPASVAAPHQAAPHQMLPTSQPAVGATLSNPVDIEARNLGMRPLPPGSALPTVSVQSGSYAPAPAPMQSMVMAGSQGVANTMQASAMQQQMRPMNPGIQVAPQLQYGQVQEMPPIKTVAQYRATHEPFNPPLEPEPREVKLFGNTHGPRLNSLLKEVDPRFTLQPDTEDLLLQLVDDFVSSVTTHAMQLAKHRNSDVLETGDIQLCLRKEWGMPWLGIHPPPKTLAKALAGRLKPKKTPPPPPPPVVKNIAPEIVDKPAGGASAAAAPPTKRKRAAKAAGGGTTKKAKEAKE